MRSKHTIPGFSLTFGFVLLQLLVMVFLPLGALIYEGVIAGWSQWLNVLGDARIIHAFYVSLLCALAAMVINGIFGTVVAWILERYDFLGKGIIDGLVDIPFALPTAVAGIALTSLYSEQGWIGRYLYAWGIESAFSMIGITIALVFIGIPFVVRSVGPVLRELAPECEEAAHLLGAGQLTTFVRVIFPEIWPAIISGAVLSFARALGEYGSVVFIAGNIPFSTEIVPLLIVSKMEQYDYNGAIVISLLLLALACFLMGAVHSYRRRQQRIKGV